MASKTYTIASTFARDHWERDCGQTDVVLRHGKNTVTVVLDDDGYSDMLSDAEYYWECRDEFYGGGYQSICRSAGRVARALKKAGAPSD